MNNFTKIENIDGTSKWVNIEAKVIQIWDNAHDSISQIGLLGDETDIIKFISWKKAGKPEIELGEVYRIKNLAVSEYNGGYSVSINKNTKICPIGQQELEI
ncbi:MAG: hypothetical protein PHX22_10995 [Dysgonamonadaceae bacterium]|nr:hypothetical protein [Dysgonamonadaceae bacterium]